MAAMEKDGHDSETRASGANLLLRSGRRCVLRHERINLTSRWEAYVVYAQRTVQNYQPMVPEGSLNTVSCSKETMSPTANANGLCVKLLSPTRLVCRRDIGMIVMLAFWISVVNKAARSNHMSKAG